MGIKTNPGAGQDPGELFAIVVVCRSRTFLLIRDGGLRPAGVGLDEIEFLQGAMLVACDCRNGEELARRTEDR